MNASELFFWGFDGTSVTKAHRDFLRRFPPAGVILFARNLENKKQIQALTRDLKKAAGRRIFIGIDEEGGRVRRLTPEFIKFPPAEFWGRVYEREKDLSLIERFAVLLGRELRSIGVNTDFAPVLDVNSNPKNPIIGDRSFSSDPKRVALIAMAFAKGLLKSKILPCGKHFPGHGDTETDSHLTLPHVERPRKILEKVELFPFREAVKKNIPMLMTAHVVYRHLDADVPATLSSKIMTDLLRKRWKYRGVVISDDLQMKAVAQKYTEAESSSLALAAGVDILLVCRDMETRGEGILREFEKSVQHSPFLQKRVLESLSRIRPLALKMGH